METIRHVALGCCVISTVAGMVRVFWPENGFTAVINAVLSLYIVTAGLQMLRGADWHALTAELYRLTPAGEQTTEQYSEYGRELGLSVSADAVRQVLAQAGIEASVQIEDGTCHVNLVRSSDQERAQAVLAASCGELPYEIVAGGGAT